MPNKMLIDTSHPEETRVVVVRGNRIEEFDFESQDKKQLRGNIYLARVTRVEPSLQAAFVEYGGNRHGFLAFSEIHPDYYQIPVADRQALVRAEAEEAKAEDEDADEGQTEQRGRKRRRGGSSRRSSAKGDAGNADAADTDDSAEDGKKAAALAAEAESVSEQASSNSGDDRNGNDDDDEVDTVGAEDALDEAQNRRKPMRRSYKIQEVIKRRQILLVQVVKEERGNKGAALTTYLSLAGRYSVLMPNTARGGGISRKITNLQDRKRLKDVVRGLDVPDGMGVILRTAGANRTKAEIKRDYEYLMRLWEKVRSLTLESTAPALVYEEGSLIKRSVRDLYNKDIDEILVAGEDGYREAKDFMRMLMPSHAKVVQPYRDSVPIFARNGIEAQLDKMLQPQVNLKSGGYIIINQTEALVAIDVNSGRSTKEHSIEDTALQTNLEAAEEVARQLRLRDLAGLIVIDFIDMEENRNNRAVEKRLKECLKSDRARIQVGRISHFGLLEMSRQRIRTSVLESTMQPCPHCGGTGHVRSESSVALLVVRAIEEYLLKDARNDITVRTPTTTALYLLNQKRSNLADLENRFGVRITVEADDGIGAQHYAIAKGALADKTGVMEQTPTLFEDIDAEDAEVDAALAAETEEETGQSGEEGGGGRKRRRRKRRRGGRDKQPGEQTQAGAQADADDGGDAPDEVQEPDGEPAVADESQAQESGERKKRRRGKRGGRRNRREEAETSDIGQMSGEVAAAAGGAEATVDTASAPQDAPVSEEASDSVMATPEDISSPEETTEKKKPARKPRKTAKKAVAKTEVAEEDDGRPAEDAKAEPVAGDVEEPAAKPAKAKRSRRGTKTVEKQPVEEPVVSSSLPSGEEPPRKKGWWQKKGFF